MICYVFDVILIVEDDEDDEDEDEDDDAGDEDDGLGLVIQCLDFGSFDFEISVFLRSRAHKKEEYRRPPARFHPLLSDGACRFTVVEFGNTASFPKNRFRPPRNLPPPSLSLSFLFLGH